MNNYGRIRKTAKTHLCISCRNLLRVTRKVRKNENGDYIGYRFVAKCGKKRNSRNPWTALPCIEFQENENQKSLIDYFQKQKGVDSTSSEDQDFSE